MAKQNEDLQSFETALQSLENANTDTNIIEYINSWKIEVEQQREFVILCAALVNSIS